MRVAIGMSIVVLCCSRATLRRPAKSAITIRKVRWKVGRINRRGQRGDRVVNSLIAHVDHSRCACRKAGWPMKETDLQEGRLQPDLERGNRTRLIAKSRFEMSEG